jgi:hypothetical protein
VQRLAPGADTVVKVVLEAVLLVEAGARDGSLGPEVRGVVGAPELEWDEVVDLVGAAAVARDPIER